jgi:hypothetical protein
LDLMWRGYKMCCRVLGHKAQHKCVECNTWKCNS